MNSARSNKSKGHKRTQSSIEPFRPIMKSMVKAKTRNDINTIYETSAQTGRSTKSKSSMGNYIPKVKPAYMSAGFELGVYGNPPNEKLDSERKKIREGVKKDTTTTGRLKEYRQSLQVDALQHNKLRQSVSISVARASVAFNTNSTEAGDKIQNERLRNTILIMEQKLKNSLDSDAVIQRQRQSNIDLETEIGSLKTEISTEKHNHSKLQNLYQSVKNENVGLQSSNKQLTASRDIQEQYIQDLRGQNERTINELKSEHEALMNNLVLDLDFKISENETKNKGFALELDESEEARKFLKQDIELLNDQIIGFEEDLFQSKSIQLDLLENLKNCEKNLTGSEEKVADLITMVDELEKTQAVYIAHKYDHVDKTLGNYLNSKPEKNKMNIMFLRESEGVYQFGKRKVYIRIESGNKILVRVGGGYMHIDEFIETYTQSETDKIERKDVLSRFQNKGTVQKIIVDQSIMDRETSPIREKRLASPRKGGALNLNKISPRRNPYARKSLWK